MYSETGRKLHHNVMHNLSGLTASQRDDQSVEKLIDKSDATALVLVISQLAFLQTV